VLNSPQCTAPVPPRFRSCNQIIFNAQTGDPSLGPVQLARNGYDRIPHDERDGYAVFGEATVSLTDTLDLAFGVRYHEENIFSEQLAPPRGAAAPRPLVWNRWHVGGVRFAGVEATVGPGVPWEHTSAKVTSRLSLQRGF